ncbi:MAG: tRNA lysidine(34) synthetase TilS [Acidimicrobiia bacterium]
MAATDRLTPERLASEAHEILPAGSLVVALGGGADSAVAAWTAAQRTTTRGIFARQSLDGSPALEEAAGALGAHLGIGVTYVDAPVDAGPSLESRAREARWGAIVDAVDADETVVTGHTQDDQAETVMMNLMRGSGSAGIAGMLRSRPGVVRPLLRYSRADIRSLAEELSLPFVDDPANEDERFLRNRIRRHLLPDLEADYAPGVRGTLARTGALAAADDYLIEGLTDEIPVVGDAQTVSIPIAPLVTAPQPVAARSVRRALRRLLDPYAGSEADVESVLSVAAGRSESAMISGTLSVTREGPYVTVDSGRGATASSMPIAVSVPAEIRFGQHVLTFENVDVRKITRVSTLLLDPQVFGGGTLIRAAAEGDRIDIASGSKAVRTVLSERGIPVRRRSTWPVVAEGARIAAIVGIRAAPWARPTTRQAVAIRWKQESP